MFRIEHLPEKISEEHRAKLAYVYVRQSSLVQVVHHQESTHLQYQLVERAIQLGWPRERIEVVDDDLGKSGASAAERLGRVGLVLSLDASRLARNNYDWYQLLELCTVFGALIADSERVYDPLIYSDRLLLGLSGMMSEAELHQLKRRLNAGAWNKAARGELRQSLPVGLVRLRGDEVILHPDEEVQARLRLVFDKFAELRVAKAVMRYFQAQDLWLPSRPLQGPAPQEVVWRPACSSMILGILKNPAYAGAYVYGQHTLDPTRRKPGHPTSGVIQRPIDKWPIVIQNAYPAYISWETFVANQAQLASNQSQYQADKHGVPRQGQTLLQGILRCGRCGALMQLHYSGPAGNFPVYRCVYAQSQYGGSHCQEVRGLGLDAEVERLLLDALAPEQIELALAALSEIEQEDAALKRQQELHLERLRYEAERARRQYDTVEPENRLVARTLENRWEEALRALEKAEQAHDAWLRQQQLVLTTTDQTELLALGQDLPRVWYAPSTTPADRKHILRLVVKEVVVDQKRTPGQVWFQINWQTGAVTQHEYERRVSSYAEHPRWGRLEQRLRELHQAQKLDAEIAETLNAEGFLTTKRLPFNGNAVWLLRKHLHLPPVKHHGCRPLRWEDGTYSVEGVAQALGVFPGTVYKWLQTGRLEGHQLRKGLPWKITLTPEIIHRLQQHLAQARRVPKKPSILAHSCLSPDEVQP